MYSSITRWSLHNGLNSRASICLSGFQPFFHENACGFSSTAFRENAGKVAENISKPKLERIADEFLSLNILERHDFKILFGLKLGLDRFAGSAGAVGMVLPGAPTGSAAAASEKKVPSKTTFDVKLEKFDANAKIKIIKEVRGFTDLGLKEAKELVEKTPVVLKKGLAKEDAEKIVEKLKELGAAAIVE